MAAMGASIEEQMAVATPGADGVGDGIGSDDEYSEDLYVSLLVAASAWRNKTPTNDVSHPRTSCFIDRYMSDDDDKQPSPEEEIKDETAAVDDISSEDDSVDDPLDKAVTRTNQLEVGEAPTESAAESPNIAEANDGDEASDEYKDEFDEEESKDEPTTRPLTDGSHGEQTQGNGNGGSQPSKAESYDDSFDDDAASASPTQSSQVEAAHADKQKPEQSLSSGSSTKNNDDNSGATGDRAEYDVSCSIWYLLLVGAWLVR